MSTMNSVKISDFDQEQIADALQGTWNRRWDSVLRLTTMKSHCILSSKVVTEATKISMTLPAHQSFYLQILSSSGSRNVLIDTDKSIDLMLNAGESVSATFTLTK